MTPSNRKNWKIKFTSTLWMNKLWNKRAMVIPITKFLLCTYLYLYKTYFLSLHFRNIKQYCNRNYKIWFLFLNKFYMAKYKKEEGYQTNNWMLWCSMMSIKMFFHSINKSTIILLKIISFTTFDQWIWISCTYIFNID